MSGLSVSGIIFLPRSTPAAAPRVFGCGWAQQGIGLAGCPGRERTERFGVPPRGVSPARMGPHFTLCGGQNGEFRSSSNGVNPLKALDEKRKMTPCAARVSAPFGYFGWRHPKYPRLDGAFGCAMIPCGPRTPCVLTRLTPQNWAKPGKEHKGGDAGRKKCGRRSA